ncbi:hypothetical protein JCM30566_19800 [Marinitoga arctica]
MKRNIFILLIIIIINTTFFGFESILPESKVLDEGVLQIDGITPQVAAIRYGLFGFLEVGASTNNGGAYIKSGINRLFNTSISISVSYGYQVDLQDFGEAHLIGIAGYDAENYRVSFGTDYVQDVESEFDPEKNDTKVITQHYLNPFGGISYLLYSDDQTEKLINLEFNSSLNLESLEYGIAFYLYGVQVFRNFLFFNNISFFGGIAMVGPNFPPDLLKDFKIIFGVNSNINLF